ncbi:MAG: efflux transporter periplasmic adaptor subunit, partial [Candidatus Thiodiazotropha taylori]|nr:efflux transporter periplasmic adaptor subunit [Candidatus Thiodiazotropha taylori]MCW4232554.1 efflux transporter periplasmic adaptor subunit [Candidatus Thiodiazotropha taylori]
RVEPFGFTKISALGIEEQRVNVIIDFTSPHKEWNRIAHGYQVDARIVLWRGKQVLKIPLTALFRDGKQWSVFIEQDGLAEQRQITIGYRTGFEAEVTEGLNPGERIIVHPSDKIKQGVLLEGRE